MRRLLASILFLLAANPVRAAISIDVTAATGRATVRTSITSPSFSTAVPSELSLALTAKDYLSGPNTSGSGVSGAGLTWVLVVCTGAQSGTAGIWRASAPAVLTNVSVPAAFSQAVSASMTVMTFAGGSMRPAPTAPERSGRLAAGAPRGFLLPPTWCVPWSSLARPGRVPPTGRCATRRARIAGVRACPRSTCRASRWPDRALTGATPCQRSGLAGVPHLKAQPSVFEIEQCRPTKGADILPSV
jgi:hypothetical protein